jgi:hypothetical protein
VQAGNWARISCEAPLLVSPALLLPTGFRMRANAAMLRLLRSFEEDLVVAFPSALPLPQADWAGHRLQLLTRLKNLDHGRRGALSSDGNI